MKKIDESSVGMPLENLELFTADGHLTDSAFALLIQEKLDPLQSLEVSEHLSFCDRCLERYTAILCGEPIPDAGGAEQALPVTPHLLGLFIAPPPPAHPAPAAAARHSAKAAAEGAGLLFEEGHLPGGCRVTGAGLLVRRPVHFRNLVRSC